MSKKAAAAAEQARLLKEMTTNVKRHAFAMKRKVDEDDLKEALKHASSMLNELRTGLLSPTNYYQLYMIVFDELRFLEMFFADVHRKGHTNVVKLYEMVQHAGNVLTRLYLLITVGSVYIQSKEAPAKDILRDMVEMVKGVQQPTRGLFLRYYLVQKTKDKLPDTASDYEGAGGTVADAIDFTIQNWAEMVRLWVRMQHSNVVRNRKRRERERKQLRLLVGASLERLSAMEGVDLATYQTVVLPKVLEQITNCKDKIAQQYLMDCCIHVFADTYHIRTLEPFLVTCAGLLPEVNVKEIVVALMNRLAEFAEEDPDNIPGDINAFEKFNTHCMALTKARSETMAIGDVLQLQAALLGFSIQAYPRRLDYVDHVLKFCSGVLEATGDERLDADNMNLVVHLLTLPQDTFALNVLQLNNYPKLMTFLVFNSRRSVAVKLLRSVLASRAKLDTEDVTARLLTFLAPLVRDEDDTPTAEADSKEDFEEEQRLMARLVHLMRNDDTDKQFRIYGTARRFFGHGTARRIQHTLVPMVFRSLDLARKVWKREQAGERPTFASRKVFQFVHEICTALASSHPEVSLRLFLRSGQAADGCRFDPIAYEFFTQAFILYEDLVGTKVQVAAMTNIIASLHSCMNLEPANYENLITRATQYSAKLLKKPDQCRMVCMCARLFYKDHGGPSGGPYRRPSSVLECLQRSLEIADVCMPQSCQLFVQILNSYMYFFERGCPTITVVFITGLISLITEHIENMEKGDAWVEVEAHFRNTLKHIETMQEKPGPDGGRSLYADVVIS